MASAARVQTVLGPIPAEQLGKTLMHEHLLVNVAPPAGSPGTTAEDRLHWGEPITLENLNHVRRHPDLYRSNLLYDSEAEALDELVPFTRAGGGCIVDVTSVGIGREPSRLKSISRAAGVHIVMGCGYYTAPFHPRELAGRSEDDIADEMIHDLTDGCDGVVAGIIGEIGLTWPVHPDEAKVLRAAVKAQLVTGAPVSIHPGRHPSAPVEAVKTVLREGGDPMRTIVCHLDGRLADMPELDEVAATGCYLEIDLFGIESSHFPASPDFDMPNDAVRVRQVKHLIDAGHGSRILVSSDMAMKFHRRRYGGWGYGHILLDVVPLMVNRGISAAEVDDILVHNPARVLAR
jgi:phosphotriesterase-related protein